MSDTHDEKVERRNSFRLDMEKELVDIVWTDENGQECINKVACLDFSRGGLKLYCQQSLPLNSAVTVMFTEAINANHKLSGKVLRCIEREDDCYEVALILDKDN
jgi:c-di-GMP-binding flagellar brake protein YcgR